LTEAGSKALGDGGGGDPELNERIAVDCTARGKDFRTVGANISRDYNFLTVASTRSTVFYCITEGQKATSISNFVQVHETETKQQAAKKLDRWANSG
jgi:DUF917 family protein